LYRFRPWKAVISEASVNQYRLAEHRENLNGEFGLGRRCIEEKLSFIQCIGGGYGKPIRYLTAQ
jgi:hypothetical protein